MMPCLAKGMVNPSTVSSSRYPGDVTDAAATSAAPAAAAIAAAQTS